MLKSESDFALQRLTGSYKYFEPHKHLGKGKYRFWRAVFHSLRSASTDGAQIQYANGEAYVHAIKRGWLGQHVDGWKSINEAGWFTLIVQGYFEDTNPEMRLFKYDQKVAGAQAEESNSKRSVKAKYQQAVEQARDQNRKVGKHV